MACLTLIVLWQNSYDFIPVCFFIIPTLGQLKSVIYNNVVQNSQKHIDIAVFSCYVFFCIIVLLSLFILIIRKKFKEISKVLFLLLSSIVPLFPMSASKYIRNDFVNMDSWSWYIYVPSIFFCTLLYFILKEFFFNSNLKKNFAIKFLILFLPVTYNLYLFQTYGKNVVYIPNDAEMNIFNEIKTICKSAKEDTNIYVFGKLARYVPPFINASCQKNLKTLMILPDNDPRLKRLKPLSRFLEERDPRLEKIKPVDTVIDYGRFVKKLQNKKNTKVFYFFDSTVMDLSRAFQDEAINIPERELIISAINKREKEHQFLLFIKGKDYKLNGCEFWLAGLDNRTKELCFKSTSKKLSDIDMEEIKRHFEKSFEDCNFYIMFIAPQERSFNIPDGIKNLFSNLDIKLPENGGDGQIFFFIKDEGWKLIKANVVQDNEFSEYSYLYF